MDEVESVVVSAIAAKAEHQPKLTDELSRLSIDSLSMAEAAFEIEQKLHVKLGEGILDQRTVGDLVKHVQSLHQQQSMRRG